MSRLHALLALLTAACAPDGAIVDGIDGPERVISVTFGGGLCPYGECFQQLSFEADGGLVVDGFDVDGTPWQRTGALTAAGAAALADAEADLGEVSFDEVYGCPGCNDGAAITVALWALDLRTEVETTFEADEPPAELAALVALATDLAWALRECEPLAEAEVAPGCTPAF